MSDTILWAAFALVVIPLLALDLGLFRRESREMTFRSALSWSVIWVAVALTFAGGVFLFRGSKSGMEFLTGYILEKALSADNVFLFAVLFGYFSVPARSQHRILFWGVMGAIVMRAVMIGVGAALIAQFHWILYLFGAFLILTGVKMALHRQEETDFAQSGLLRWIRFRLPMTETYQESKFFVMRDGKRLATPLFLALVMIEITDLAFAIDSIPAVFAVTTDPFIVFTSNVFAILGLRALYFLLANVMERFCYLKTGLAVILTFVGVKMLLPFKLPAALSLGVIAGILAITVAASLWKPRNAAKTPALPGSVACSEE